MFSIIRNAMFKKPEMHSKVQQVEIVKNIWKGIYDDKEVIFKKRGKHYDSDNEIKILLLLKDCGLCTKLIAFDENSVIINYFKNGDLYEYTQQQGGKLPLLEACKMTYYICKAAIEIHALGVHHLDLKLDNICLDENMIPHIIDFASSQIINNEPISTFATTIPYISPECAALYIELINSGEPYKIFIKHKKIMKYGMLDIDTWSIGVIFYVLIFGIFPFGRNVERVLKLDYSFPSEIPGQVKLLIRRILVIDGRSRPNLEEICLILEQFIDIP